MASTFDVPEEEDRTRPTIAKVIGVGGGGGLMAFPASGDEDGCVKLFAVDPKFKALIDDQAEEDERQEAEKERRRARGKKGASK